MAVAHALDEDDDQSDEELPAGVGWPRPAAAALAEGGSVLPRRDNDEDWVNAGRAATKKAHKTRGRGKRRQACVATIETHGVRLSIRHHWHWHHWQRQWTLAHSRCTALAVLP